MKNLLVISMMFGVTGVLADEAEVLGRVSRDVLELLAHGGTCWRGSSSWKDKLQSRSDYSGKIVLAKLNGKYSTGWRAQFRWHNWQEADVVAAFVVSRSAERVMIESKLEHRDLFADARSLHAQLALQEDGQQYEQSDRQTSCKSVVQVRLDSKSKQVSYVIQTTCQTCLELDQLMSILSENQESSN